MLKESRAINAFTTGNTVFSVCKNLCRVHLFEHTPKTQAAKTFAGNCLDPVVFLACVCCVMLARQK